jgi:hypothetical protein
VVGTYTAKDISKSVQNGPRHPFNTSNVSRAGKAVL